MAAIQHEFYRSSRGPGPADEDWWSLVFDPETRRLLVRHEWQASGHGGFDDLDVTDAGDARQPMQTLDGKAPVVEVIARVHIARLVNLDRRGVARELRAVGLEHDFAARRQHVGERLQQRDRIGHPVQDAKAQRDVESLTELAHVQRVHPAVLDPRGE